ncbi:MAG: hypothetical protein HQM10_12370 [Candidatus Riflebacteria bacterium]|nr:hypothetical protein [Candidatus Riflebacteria bacterium]
MNFLFVCKATFCLLFFACFVFWVGKKIGERKYLQIKEEMKALELSFNQLLNEVELMVSQNLNVMDSKIAETRELLPILDNKLLQSYDIITRLDEEKPTIRTADSTTIEARAEIVNFGKKCSAVKSSFENRFNALEQKIHSLENIISRVEASLSNINQNEILLIPAQTESSSHSIKTSPIASPKDFSSIKAPEAISQKTEEKKHTVIPEKHVEVQPDLFSSQPEKPKTHSKPIIKTELFSVQSKNSLKTEMKTELLQMYSTRLKNVQNLEMSAESSLKSESVQEIKAEKESEKKAETEKKAEIRSLKTDIKLSDIPDKKPIRELYDLPPQGTPFYDVISLIRQGTTIPQVAKQLKLTIGEVELIRNLFPKSKLSLSQSAR